MAIETVSDRTVIVQQRKSGSNPNFFQVPYKIVHHFLGVEWCWCHPKSFLSSRNCRIVDRLNVMSIINHKLIANLRTEQWVAHRNRDYVTCTGQLRKSCVRQSSFQCSHIFLVLSPQLSPFLAPKNLIRLKNDRFHLFDPFTNPYRRESAPVEQSVVKKL